MPLKCFVVLVLLCLPGAGWAQPASRSVPAARPLPEVIPLFPLPNVVLFPEAARPLLIFEPRYREMVADALEGDRIIGMVLLQPGYERDYEGRPPIHAIGCAGEIEDYELLPDGRYTIVLRGLTKFRVLSEDQRRPYRLARVAPMPEPLTNADLDRLADLRQQVEAALIRVLPPNADLPPAQLSDIEFVHLTAQYWDMAETTRQDLLEEGSPLARARALLEVLRGR